MDTAHIESYKKIAQQARIKIIDMIYRAQTSHVGSNLSCVDILTVLFQHLDLDKDVFVLSKGWAAASLYYFLWRQGRITEDELNSYCQEGSKWIGLAEPVCGDIKIAGGSMGLGLPGAVGLALAKKMKGEEGKVYVLMSDGEMQIGTTWESALIAAQHKLDNLIVIVDFNGLQAMGLVNEILNINSLDEKWKSFGWDVDRINGHDYVAIENRLEVIRYGSPICIIADTIKGKGVSFMERQNLYHYKQLSQQEYEDARKELEWVK